MTTVSCVHFMHFEQVTRTRTNLINPNENRKVLLCAAVQCFEVTQRMNGTKPCKQKPEKNAAHSSGSHLRAGHSTHTDCLCSIYICDSYRLKDRGSIPDRGADFYLRHRVQTVSGAYPASCPMGAPSFGVKRPGPEADHSLLSSSEVMNTWSYTSTPPDVFIEWRTRTVKRDGHWLLWGYQIGRDGECIELAQDMEQ
jgi:hypothetical protein